MTRKGLTTEEAQRSRREHGDNRLTQVPTEPLWKKVLRGFTDPMIVILLVALVIQVILFCFGRAEWFEPLGVLIAILIANGVSAVSESRQEGKALALKEAEAAGELTKVIRDGVVQEIPVAEIVVGDLVFLQAGDKICADGVIVEGELKADQASLNGETEEAEKIPLPEGASFDPKDLLNPYYAYRGTVVCGGEGYLEVRVVGDRTLFGELALEVQEDKRKTPLQIKLGKLARQISVFGYVGAAAIVAAILLKTLLTGQAPADFTGWLGLLINAVTVAVTVIVCAVPEGLPMLTSILLSYQSLRMAKDNVLVRKINGLETAGSISILFSDKTGTITQGCLSVTELATGDAAGYDSLAALGRPLIDELVIGIGVNNSAVPGDGGVIGGNSTDRALLSFLLSSGEGDGLTQTEVESFQAFDSRRKYSSVTVRREHGTVTYLKGAPERLIRRCSRYLDSRGETHPLSDRQKLLDYINRQASRSMRLLAVVRAGDGEEDGTLLCVLSIRDNVRPEAAQAIREVRQAGIQVVMVTGDRKETAVAIAREAGLMETDADRAITSAEMAALPDEELRELLPDIRVVARALPADKSRLVRLAQERGLVVGMTGDGVNDAPALKKADVGFAMGSGTEVAKEAGDITILDDNFSSIEKAILYGRTMFKSIRKFLIFQLTVNVAAVLLCFIGPLLGENVVLTVIQLLLINLAMDTLAAIAFGSEPTRREYMREKPVPRSAGIVSGRMLAEILLSAGYITLMCLSVLFIPPVSGLFACSDPTYLRSAMFAAFMMAITFNGFNARTESRRLWRGLSDNKRFIAVMAVILIVQFVFVTFGGTFLSVEALSPMDWLLCTGLALMVIPLDFLRKTVLRFRQTKN